MAKPDLNLGLCRQKIATHPLRGAQVEETIYSVYGGGWPGEHDGQIACEKLGRTPVESQRTPARVGGGAVREIKARGLSGGALSSSRPSQPAMLSPGSSHAPKPNHMEGLEGSPGGVEGKKATSGFLADKGALARARLSFARS